MVHTFDQLQGVSLLTDEWKALSEEHKLRTVVDYAGIIAALSKCRFDSIGSLYFGGERGSYRVGPLSRHVEARLGQAPSHDPDLGPWGSASEWLEAVLKEQIRLIAPDEHLAPDSAVVPWDSEWTEGTQKVLALARETLPKLLERVGAFTAKPADNLDRAPFVLTHTDLSAQ
jgi:hypothetical protein